MKNKLILIAAILFAANISNAQTQKGTRALGLTLGYSNSTSSSSSLNSLDETRTTQSSKYSTTAAGLNYSYFIVSGTEIGGGLSFDHSRQNGLYYYGAGSSNQQSTDLYGASIFLRKYFLFQDKFGFRTGPFAGYQHGVNKYSYVPSSTVNDNNTSNGYNVGAKFDLVYYPSKKLGLAANIATLSYSHNKASGEAGYNGKQENFGFNLINNGLMLSLFYVIGSN